LQERLFDVDRDRDDRRLSLRAHPRQQGLSRTSIRASVQPQRLLDPRNHDEEAGVRFLQDVLKRVGPSLAGAFQNDTGVLL
jgi:hypothetical protein